MLKEKITKTGSSNVNSFWQGKSNGAKNQENIIGESTIIQDGNYTKSTIFMDTTEVMLVLRSSSPGDIF